MCYALQDTRLLGNHHEASAAFIFSAWAFNTSPSAITPECGFSGTPSFVIGDALIPGYVEAQVLIDEVEKTRTQED